MKRDPAQYFHRNFVITGIPRSGTSLFHKVVNVIPNVVCLNEVIDPHINMYNVSLLPGSFALIREMLWRGEAIPNRYDEQGKLTSNTMKDGEDLQYNKINKEIAEDVVIGSKINAPYLFALEQLVWNRFKIFAIIRHPVFVIGSYQQEYTKTLNIANCDTDERYSWFKWKGRTKIEYQAELWEYFAQKLLKNRNFLTIYRYEDITGRSGEVVDHFKKQFELETHDIHPVLSNYNKESRYQKILEIKKAVEKFCPSMKEFQYVVKNDQRSVA